MAPAVSGHELLTRLAAGYQRRRLAAQAVLAGGGALLGAGLAHAAGGNSMMQWLAAVALAGAIVIGATARNRRRPAGPTQMAQHLDRALPSTEDSTGLVLIEPAALPLLGRMERARVERALAATPVSLPADRSTGPLVIAAIVAAIAGAALLALPAAAGGSRARFRPGSRRSVAAIGGVGISITPPAYTGAAARRETQWDIEVPEGSTVTWRVAAVGDSAWITTSDGDTLPLVSDGRERTATLRAASSLLYEVTVQGDSNRLTSPLHRLAVQADRPPSLVVATPQPRLRLGPGDRLRVPVEIRAGDDWGVGPARLVATLTSGQGEAVKFREQTVPLALSGERTDLPHGVTLRTTLDLAALGLKPGDELYFHAEAADRRTPVPNTARSETVFLSLADTGGTESNALAGLSVSLAPEFFRSQRQIIMDTEKLIAERPRITVDAFRNRSNDIGLDQSLLRSRYGQYVGDETETGGDPEAGHQHDTPENATLLAASVKAKLKAALAQMWEAEVRLRTYRPVEALPYEYRALAHLKDAQQSARVYVQRVGFEPPALDPSRIRLTGKLDGISNRTDRDSAGAAVAFPATRKAIAALGGVARPGPATPGALPAGVEQALERAITELAPRAAGDSSVFSTIREVRTFLERARTGARCDGCAERALTGLLRAVPEAQPAPVRTRVPAGALAGEYFRLLESGR